MRAKDFLIPQNLFEIKMSPSNLKKLAASIPGARVGIEFEMYVPGVDVDSENSERSVSPENDYDRDESVEDIADIVRFFAKEDDYGDTANDSRALRNLQHRLEDKYEEWLRETLESFIKHHKKQIVADYVKTAIPEPEIIDALEIDPDLFGNKQVTKKEIEQFVALHLDERTYIVESAIDNFIGMVIDDPDYVNKFKDDEDDDSDLDLTQNAWLQDSNWTTMQDIYSKFDIAWPFTTIPEEDDYGYGELDGEQFAEDFSEQIGRPCIFSHSVTKQPPANGYVVVPDASLDSSEGGLEIKSAPFSPEEMSSEIEKIKEWADNNDVRTNSTTGMHINVSVPNYSRENLDYVKLVLLLGDEYVSKQFNRLGTYYAQSAFRVIQSNASLETIEALFDKLKSNMESIASKVIHEGYTDKYTSINTKENRVEIRSPGNDYLGKYYKNVIDTVNRTVVALDAACDPKKYREEYMKKLAKAFAPSQGSIEALFIDYQAGNISKYQLKRKLEELRSYRNTKKLKEQGIIETTLGDMHQGDWIVEFNDGNMPMTQRIVVKKTEQVTDEKAAFAAAMKLAPEKFSENMKKYITITANPGSRQLYRIKMKDGSVPRTATLSFRTFTANQALDNVLYNYSDIDRNTIVAELVDEAKELEDALSTDFIVSAPDGSEAIAQRAQTAEEAIARVRETFDLDPSTRLVARRRGEQLPPIPEFRYTFQWHDPSTGITYREHEVEAEDLRHALALVISRNDAFYEQLGSPRLLRSTDPSVQIPESDSEERRWSRYEVSDPAIGASVTVSATSPDDAITRARGLHNPTFERGFENGTLTAVERS